MKELIILMSQHHRKSLSSGDSICQDGQRGSTEFIMRCESLGKQQVLAMAFPKVSVTV